MKAPAGDERSGDTRPRRRPPRPRDEDTPTSGSGRPPGPEAVDAVEAVALPGADVIEQLAADPELALAYLSRPDVATARAVRATLATLAPVAAIEWLEVVAPALSLQNLSDFRRATIARLDAPERAARLLAETAGPRGGPDPSAPWWAWDALVGALADLANDDDAPLPPAAPDDDRADTWEALLRAARAIGKPGRYVGAYRRAVAEVTIVAADLAPADRTVAAEVVLHRAAATALRWPEFVEGARAAADIDPGLLDPATFVHTVVRTCLRYNHQAPRVPAVSYGVRLALEVIAAQPSPRVSEFDVGVLQRALQLLPDNHLAFLDQRATRYPPEVREVIEEILHPDRKRPRRRRRRR